MSERLWPFFPFYGSKWRSIPKYPVPVFPRIVESFAGSASYSVTYPDRDITLCDRDPVICGVWRYLVSVTPSEILAIPDIREHIDEISRWPQEARWLVGFWLNKGSAVPKAQHSAWSRTGLYPNQFWGQKVRERLAAQVSLIRHWKIVEGSYESLSSVPGTTHFVDPPYSSPAGRRYRGGRTGIDYAALAAWCRSRQGQVIACAQVGEDWLPFRPFLVTKANHATAWSHEAIWTGDENRRATLF